MMSLCHRFAGFFSNTSESAFPWPTLPPPQREAAAPPQAAKHKLAVTIWISPPHCLLAVTQDCDWAAGGKGAYASRRAAAQDGGLPGSALRVFHQVTWPSFWLYRARDCMQRQEPRLWVREAEELVSCLRSEDLVLGIVTQAGGEQPPLLTRTWDGGWKLFRPRRCLGRKGGFLPSHLSWRPQHPLCTWSVGGLHGHWMSEGKMFIVQLPLHLLSHHWLLIVGKLQFLLTVWISGSDLLLFYCVAFLDSYQGTLLVLYYSVLSGDLQLHNLQIDNVCYS